MTRTRKLALSFVAVLALAAGMFVTPVTGTTPIVSASAHYHPAGQVCGAFFANKASMWGPYLTGMVGRYVTHTRSGDTYRVAYAWTKVFPVSGGTHVDWYTCKRAY